MENKIEKQLNRISCLLGKESIDEEKIKMVLQGIFQEAESSKIKILPSVEKKKCAMCDSAQPAYQYTLDCDHSICSNDCMSELLINSAASNQISCPLNHCEISTLKQTLFESAAQAEELQEMVIICVFCQQSYQIQNSVKLSCSHRYCIMCLTGILSQEDAYFKNRCIACLEMLSPQSLQKINNLINKAN